MRTVQEIIEWVEEESARSLQQFRDEPNKNGNHLATAYLAEYEMLERLKEFILEKTS
jgi:hypothetical protein